MLPFLIGGVLVVVYRDAIADLFRSRDEEFYANLLGEERAQRLEREAGSRLSRFDESWIPRLVLVFGILLIVISVAAVVAPLV